LKISFFVLEVEIAVHDSLILLRSWIVEDTSTYFLLFLSLFFVSHGLIKDLILGVKFVILIGFEIVALEKSANSESDLSLTPFSLEYFHLVLDVLEVGGSILDHTLSKSYQYNSLSLP